MILPLPFLQRLAGLAVLLTLLAPAASAQVLDPAFQPTALETEFSSNYNGGRAMAVQPDGKVVMSSDCQFFNHTLGGRVRRFNPDGTLDPTFRWQGLVGPDTNGQPALAVQADGKILVGGQQGYYNQVPTGGLARLNPDGSVDTSFNAGQEGFLTGVGRSFVSCVVVQPDGKIVVGGDLKTYNGVPVACVVRLNADGSLDSNFALPATAFTYGPSTPTVSAVLVQADGKLLIGGTFDTVLGASVSNLARLTATGALDNTFAVGTGAGGQVRTLAQQPDSKLLIGGSFRYFDGVTSPSLLRLNLDGSRDASFQGATLNSSASIARVRLRPDGSLLVMGTFRTYNGTARGGLALVSSAGVLEPGFAVGAGAGSSFTNSAASVSNAIETAPGQFLISGSFVSFHGAARTGLARLGSTGQVDASYAPTLGLAGQPGATTVLANGQLLVESYFSTLNGTPVPTGSLVRLNADGSYHSAIVPAVQGQYFVQPDGRIYVLPFNTTPPGSFSRLLPSGALDPSFTPLPLGVSGNLPWIFPNVVALPSGQVLLLGTFTELGGQPRTYLARVQPNGSLDPTFVPAAPPITAFSNIVALKAVQPDGKPLLVWGGSTGDALVRLTTSGTLDASFSSGTASGGLGGSSVAVLPTGQLLLSGFGGSYLGTQPTYGTLRLQSNGSVDPSFVAARPGAAVVQPDGRLLVTRFDVGGGQDLIERLNADGSLDASFTAVAVARGYFAGQGIGAVQLQPQDGKILVSGNFTHINAQVRVGLARLTNTLLAAQPTLVAAPTLDLYPNPARNVATLRLPTAPAARSAQLLDALGRPVRAFTVPAHAAETRVDVAGLPAGVYVLRCGAASRRLVVE